MIANIDQLILYPRISLGKPRELSLCQGRAFHLLSSILLHQDFPQLTHSLPKLNLHLA